MKRTMTINDFNLMIAEAQKGKKVDIAQITEQTKIIKNILLEKTGIDLYAVIHRISQD